MNVAGGRWRIEVTHCQLLAPPSDDDPRWLHEHLATASLIVFELYLLPFVLKLFLSGGLLISLESIRVSGVESFVEGFEAVEAASQYGSNADLLLGWRDYSNMQLNLTLVGGEFEPAKLRLPPRSRPQATHTDGGRSESNESEESSLPSPTVRCLLTVLLFRHLKFLQRRRQGRFLLTRELLRMAHTSVAAWRHVLQLLVYAVQVMEHSLAEAYASTMEQLHERLRGGDPLPVAGELCVQLRELLIEDIHVQLTHIAPLPLDWWLESRPLSLSSVSLLHQGWTRASDIAEAQIACTWRAVEGEERALRWPDAESFEALTAGMLVLVDTIAGSAGSCDWRPDGLEGVSVNELQHRVELALLKELVPAGFRSFLSTSIYVPSGDVAEEGIPADDDKDYDDLDEANGAIYHPILEWPAET
jgi:hypothetical protein